MNCTNHRLQFRQSLAEPTHWVKYLRPVSKSCRSCSLRKLALRMRRSHHPLKSLKFIIHISHPLKLTISLCSESRWWLFGTHRTWLKILSFHFCQLDRNLSPGPGVVFYQGQIWLQGLSTRYLVDFVQHKWSDMLAFDSFLGALFQSCLNGALYLFSVSRSRFWDWYSYQDPWVSRKLDICLDQPRNKQSWPLLRPSHGLYVAFRTSPSKLEIQCKV